MVKAGTHFTSLFCLILISTLLAQTSQELFPQGSTSLDTRWTKGNLLVAPITKATSYPLQVLQLSNTGERNIIKAYVDNGTISTIVVGPSTSYSSISESNIQIGGGTSAPTLSSLCFNSSVEGRITYDKTYDRFLFYLPSGLKAILNNSGYLGIGSTVPTNIFQIGSVGSSGYAGNHLAIGNGTKVMAFYQSATASTWYTNSNFSLMPSGTGSTGNVGIGVPIPSQKLEVGGNALIKGFIEANSVVGNSGQYSIKSRTPGIAYGEKSGYSFISTFGSNVADLGPRRCADIIGGFSTAAWGNEYLAFCVGSNGAANDAANLTSEKVRIFGNGNVSIGPLLPSAVQKLNVSGNITVGTGSSSHITLAVPSVAKCWWNIQNDNGAMKFRTGAGPTDVPMMVLDPATGSVGINTTTPHASTKLDVNGTIRAKEIKVSLNAGSAAAYPDFVFKPGYHLRKLEEVEAYIKNNSHLPEIPTAAHTVKDGMALGAMQLKLLQKIEELTLYAIEQQKEINELKSLVKSIKN